MAAFVESGGQAQIAFREGVLLSSVSPTVAYERLTWYQSPALHLGSGACLPPIWRDGLLRQRSRSWRRPAPTSLVIRCTTCCFAIVQITRRLATHCTERRLDSPPHVWPQQTLSLFVPNESEFFGTPIMKCNILPAL